MLGGGEEEEEGKAERMIITKCYSKIQVSSNEKKKDGYFNTIRNYVVCIVVTVIVLSLFLFLCSLLDNNLESYWQSNGSPRSHWIR